MSNTMGMNHLKIITVGMYLQKLLQVINDLVWLVVKDN